MVGITTPISNNYQFDETIQKISYGMVFVGV
jgi:hypothetical protein